jgi:hypothetical protein
MQRVKRAIALAFVCAAHAAVAQPADDAGVPVDGSVDPANPVPPDTVRTDTPPAAPPSAAPPAALPPPPPPSAESPKSKEPYPIELVDRPLVLPGGATELDVWWQIQTSLQRTTDANGIEMRERSSQQTPALSVGHVFGPIKVSIDLAIGAQIRFEMLVPGQPIRLWLSASTLVPQPDHRYHIDQVANVTYKRAVIPHRLALLAEATVVLAEARLHDEAGINVEGVYVYSGAGASAEVQLAQRWCLSAGIFGGGHLYKSVPFDLHAQPGASFGIRFLLRRWDFYVNGASSLAFHPSATIHIGFEKRWGI